MFCKYYIFLLLCIGTLSAYGSIDRYIEVGDQLLVSHDFASGLQGWLVGGSKTAGVAADAGLVRLVSGDSESLVQLWQSLDPGVLGDTVVLSGTVKAVDIAGGAKGWEKGRVVLVQSVDGKAVYTTPHVLAALDGTHDWAEFRAAIPILAEASEVRVGLQLNRCTGELQVKELALFRVQGNPVFKMVRWVVLGAWALFLVGVFVPGVIGSCGGRRWPTLVVLVLVAIILGTTVPGAVKNEAKYEIISHAKTYASEIVEFGGSAFGELTAGLQAQKWLSIDITKVAHFLLFALLGGLLCARRGRGTVWLTLIDIGMLACGSELMQLFIDGRSGLFTDVVIDMAGGGVGVLSFKLKDGRGKLKVQVEGKLRQFF